MTSGATGKITQRRVLTLLTMSQERDNSNILRSRADGSMIVVTIGQTICQYKLRKEDYLKIQAKTQYSKRAIKKLLGVFLETCPTGRLQKGNIESMLSQIFPERSAASIANRIFR